jgi:Polyketide cyclase / dehydrase and lipid transport
MVENSGGAIRVKMRRAEVHNSQVLGATVHAAKVPALEARRVKARRFGIAALAAGLLTACSGAPKAAAPGAPLADGTNRAFSHEVTTTAPPEAVWALWTDASTWKDWDKGLKSAEHDGAMAVGSSGKIIPLDGPAARFTVTAMEPGRSYAFKTGLPLASLTVSREITGTAPTRFRHSVSFSGPLAGYWSGQFGPGFRAALPPTMDTLAALAEAGAPAD